MPLGLTRLTIVEGQEGGLVHIVLHIHGLPVQQGHGADLTVGPVDPQPVSRVGQLGVPTHTHTHTHKGTHMLTRRQP